MTGRARSRCRSCGNVPFLLEILSGLRLPVSILFTSLFLKSSRKKAPHRMQGVPAYVVFTDKTLREMALTQPTDLRAFQAVSGVGASKAERYGRQFLAEIAAFEG